MARSITPAWLVPVCAALADAHAPTALQRALACLAQHGLVQQPPSAGAAPWLRIERPSEDDLVLYETDADAGHEDGAGRDRVARAIAADLLRAAHAREAEHEALQSARERFDMLSAASFEGIFIHVDGVVIDVNQRLAEIMRCAPHELLGAQTMLSCVAPEDLASVMERVASRYEGEYVITGIRKDGSRFRCEMQTKQGRLGERPVRVVAVRDVTERERTHALLRESEARLRGLAEAAFDFFVLSRGDTVIEVGGAHERVMGYGREALLGRSVFDFVAPSAYALTQQVLAEQRPGGYDSLLISSTGELIPVEIVGAATMLGGEIVRIAGLRDKREARRIERERFTLQRQVERSQRVESLGVLAGGIAHDFNNLLVGVLGNAEVLLARVQAPRDRSAIEAIRHAGLRAADLTRQMLAYAGRQSGAQHEAVELGEALVELRVLLDASISKKASVELSIEPDCFVLGDRATLTQVLMNLMTNASDALSGQSGTIRVSARHVTDIDPRWDDALGATVRPGEWVLLEVRDTGCGMNESTRLRVFEPFFTTKKTGHGLGLAACLGIVRAHGGALLVESDLDRGSCFSVLLPACGSEHSATLEGSDGARVTPIGAVDDPCKVLVIDDEPLVRGQLRRLLELRGYAVEEASDGTTGLQAFAAHAPDVVVVDLSMPDLDGVEVITRIRQADPGVPIVLSSGHFDDRAQHQLPKGAVQGLLRKPYGLAELLSTITIARQRARYAELNPIAPTSHG